jgi:alpha-galactosidase
VAGEGGRIAALHDFQRLRRPYDSRRDGLFMTCTWGDRSRDAKINEQFIVKEIEAAARLGVDVYIMDDGWQAGRSSNSASGKGVWNGFWAASPDFWKPDGKRFPRGFAPVVVLSNQAVFHAAPLKHPVHEAVWAGVADTGNAPAATLQG